MLFQKKSFLNHVWDKDFYFIKFKNTTDTMTVFESLQGIKDDGTVVYNYNNYGFRCDNLTDQHEGKHILFAGDSLSFGTATPYEDVWAYRLHKKISSETKTSGYFNLGIPGASIDIIYKQVLLYITKFGKPEVLFMILPDPFRYFKYSPQLKCWYLSGCAEWEGKVIDDIWGRRAGNQEGPAVYPGTEELNKKRFAESKMFQLKVRQKAFLPEQLVAELQARYYYYLQMIELMCSSFGIRLIWSTWHEESARNIENSELYDNYISTILDKDDFLKYEKGVIDQPHAISMRDGIHHGFAYHDYFMHKFYEAYKKDASDNSWDK